MTTTQFETKQNDRKGYGAFFSDGLLDIFIGLGLVVAGALMFTEMVWMIGIYPAIILSVWQSSRKKTLARMDLQGERLHQAYQSRSRAVILGLLIAGMLTFLLGVMVFIAFDKIPAGVFAWFREYFLIVLGLLIALIFSGSASMLGIGRFHLYAAFALAIITGGGLIGIAFPWLLIVFGGVITIIGVVVLIRFLGAHPE